VEALKDEEDLCWRYQFNRLAGSAATGNISLPCRKSKPAETENPRLCYGSVFLTKPLILAPCDRATTTSPHCGIRS